MQLKYLALFTKSLKTHSGWNCKIYPVPDRGTSPWQACTTLNVHIKHWPDLTWPGTVKLAPTSYCHLLSHCSSEASYDTEQKCVCVYTHTHTHTHTCIQWNLVSPDSMVIKKQSVDWRISGLLNCWWSVTNQKNKENIILKNNKNI